jgi:hypothetical protein
VTDLDLFGPSLPAWPACRHCLARSGERHRHTCPRASVWAHFDSRRDEHDVSEQCKSMHCECHHVDEPEPGYLACGECLHLYRTARALRRAYRRKAFKIFWEDLRGRGPKLPDRDDPIWNDAPDDMKPPRFPKLQLIRSMIKLLWIKADKIYSCPCCSHDF